MQDDAERDDVEQCAQRIAKLVPSIAINLRVGALFDATASELTANQLVALILVGASEGARLRAGEIARRLSISAASSTALIDRLVNAGILERTRGDDRRVVWISVTRAGRELLARLEADTVTRISATLVGTTREERKTLVESLQNVTAFASQISDGDSTST